MHSVVDFQVDWPKLLFKSRPQLPCRDIIHVATSILRRDIHLSLCSFQLMSSDVATPKSCRDITLCLCRFQLVAHDVATSISCRDISSSLLQPSTGRLLCRDLNLLSRHQLMSLEPSLVVVGVATSVLCRDNSLSYISFIFPNLSWLQGASLVATSIPYRDINFCRDIIPLISAQASAAYLVIPVATCIKFLQFS